MQRRKNLAFCSSFNACTLFQNLQKWFLKCGSVAQISNFVPWSGSPYYSLTTPLSATLRHNGQLYGLCPENCPHNPSVFSLEDKKQKISHNYKWTSGFKFCWGKKKTFLGEIVFFLICQLLILMFCDILLDRYPCQNNCM